MSTPTVAPYKQLRRPVDDRIVAGVCSSIGRYFTIDPVLVRVGFAVLTAVTWGVAALAYPVMWFLIPEDEASPPPAYRSPSDPGWGAPANPAWDRSAPAAPTFPPAADQSWTTAPAAPIFQPDLAPAPAPAPAHAAPAPTPAPAPAHAAPAPAHAAPAPASAPAASTEPAIHPAWIQAASAAQTPATQTPAIQTPTQVQAPAPAQAPAQAPLVEDVSLAADNSAPGVTDAGLAARTKPDGLEGGRPGAEAVDSATGTDGLEGDRSGRK
ncbi:PspC domain-containing protein [Actinoplanes sp. NPDC051494]|uniref:PspC domain-containing protein n=1 Tax=Actinoplanes sp. NPDC051494 TaxID=3363907 RepID=UPI0037B59217